MLTWAAFAAGIFAAWLFLAFLTAVTFHLCAQAVRRRAYQAAVAHAIDHHPAAVAGALIRATRDQAHETYAWGPGQPVTRTDLYPCGCTVLISEDAIGWMPCPAHEAMAEVEAGTEQT